MPLYTLPRTYGYGMSDSHYQHIFDLLCRIIWAHSLSESTDIVIDRRTHGQPAVSHDGTTVHTHENLCSRLFSSLSIFQGSDTKKFDVFDFFMTHQCRLKSYEHFRQVNSHRLVISLDLLISKPIFQIACNPLVFLGSASGI